MARKPKKQSGPKRELKISAIESGTVIDHIPAEATFAVTEILKLSTYDDVISVATNLHSQTRCFGQL